MEITRAPHLQGLPKVSFEDHTLQSRGSVEGELLVPLGALCIGLKALAIRLPILPVAHELAAILEPEAAVAVRLAIFPWRYD